MAPAKFHFPGLGFSACDIFLPGRPAPDPRMQNFNPGLEGGSAPDIFDFMSVAPVLQPACQPRLF